MSRQSLAQYIRALRLSRGMTQAQLAKRMKMTQGALSKVESGALGLSLEDAVLVSRALKVPVQCFANELGYETRPVKQKEDESPKAYKVRLVEHYGLSAPLA
jgi:transcriptional regulator with XRE-family HTH domain